MFIISRLNHRNKEISYRLNFLSDEEPKIQLLTILHASFNLCNIQKTKRKERFLSKKRAIVLETGLAGHIKVTAAVNIHFRMHTKRKLYQNNAKDWPM